MPENEKKRTEPGKETGKAGKKKVPERKRPREATGQLESTQKQREAGKNPGGVKGVRSVKKYKTPGALQKKAEEYFASITYQIPLLMEGGEPVENGLGERVCLTKWTEAPSLPGLCRHLNVCKTTYREYAQAWPQVAEWIKMRMEEYWVALLAREKGGQQGIIFNLQCNFGWAAEKPEKTESRIEIVMGDEFAEFGG